MMKLTKRDGTHEEFQRSKLEENLRRIGVANDAIQAALEHVKPTDGENTAAFRNRIAAELRSQSPELARRYENSRRLEVNQSDNVAEGTAGINPTTLRHYGWKSGESVNAQHGKKSLQVKVEESTKAGTCTVRFNPRTLSSLGASEGTTISLTHQQ
jgi:hypothetical protein